jgi:hypothetical protein
MMGSNNEKDADMQTNRSLALLATQDGNNNKRPSLCSKRDFVLWRGVLHDADIVAISLLSTMYRYYGYTSFVRSSTLFELACLLACNAIFVFDVYLGLLK